LLTHPFARLTLALVALAGVACSDKGRSVVPLAVDADPSLSALKTIDVSLSQGGSEKAFKTFTWMADSVNHIGVFVPKGVTGSVDVSVTGKNAAGTKIAAAMSALAVPLVPGGASVELSLYLLPAGPDPGGTGGAMGTGTGGAG